MSNDPNIRVYFNPPPIMRGFGCIGCLLAIFVVGGIIGLLWSGWKALFGF